MSEKPALNHYGHGLMSDRSPEQIEEQSATHPPKKIRRIGWLIATAVVLISVITATVEYRKFQRPESHYLRGREALSTGEDETVMRESETLLKTEGFQSHGHLLRGLLLAKNHKPAEAIVELQRAGSDETAVEACVAAAKCFYQMGRYIPAIDAARAALTRDESAIEARRWLAAAYYDLGVSSHAIMELEKISAEAPRDPRPDRLLGLIAKDSEQYRKAVTHYRESLRRNSKQPDHQKILEELSESLVKQNQFDEALETLKQCQRSAFSLTTEADCRHALGQNEASLELLQKALEFDPQYFPAKLAQGKLLFDLGQADQAVSALAEAARIEPMNSQAHFQLSQALRQIGKDDEAAAELSRNQEIMALEREFTDLHETMSKQPTNADARFRTGELASQLGKPELSKMWFRAALAIDPHHEQARAALAKLNSVGGPAYDRIVGPYR